MEKIINKLYDLMIFLGVVAWRDKFIEPMLKYKKIFAGLLIYLINN